MSHPNAVAAPTPAASKSFPLVSLAPLAGLLMGGAALYLSAPPYDVERFLEMLGAGGWRTGVSLGTAACGALLMSWAVGAMSRGRRVPVFLLLAIPGASWLVGVALSFGDLYQYFTLMPSLRETQRPTLFASGMSLASLPRLIGAFMAAGLLLSMSLAMAFSAVGAARSNDGRAVQLTNRAVWLGAGGLVTGCVALLAVASLEVYEALAGYGSTQTLLDTLSWGVGQLGAMRWATGATLLACGVLATGFTLVSTRREGLGVRTVFGAMGAALPLLVSSGADALFGRQAEAMLSSILEVRSVPPGFEPMRLPGANGFHLTHENTRPFAVTDADIVVVAGAVRSSEKEGFAGSTLLPWESLETDEGLQRLKEHLGAVLPEARQRALHEDKSTGGPSPALSIALDTRVPMGALARVIATAREAGAEGLFFVGQSADHDDPAVRTALRTHAPGLERALDAPLGVSTWFAPPDDERASERLLLRARLTGEGSFEVGPIEGEGPRFQVDPARQVFRESDEPDTARGVAPSGPAPVVMLSVGSAPSATSLLEAAAALRARGFQVVLER